MTARYTRTVSPASPREQSQYQRNALAPAILAAAACLAGIALVGHEYYQVVRYIIAILAVIIGWFALQARQWWWVPVMLAIAILWNPLYPFEFSGTSGTARTSSPRRSSSLRAPPSRRRASPPAEREDRGTHACALPTP